MHVSAPCGRLALAAAVAVAVTAALPAQGARPQTVTPAQIDTWKQELSNWGRWGEDDQKGALNLITRAKRRAAADLVQEGFSVSLARRADYESNLDTEINIPGTGPYVRNMTRPTLDWFELRYHGWAHTHIDSLAHGTDGDVSYNGYVDDDEAVMTTGQPRNAIDVAEHGIFTRGILMDIPRLKGVPARNRWEFLLTVAPLRMVGGTGSPINPIATF